MAYVERRGPGRWRARYRGPDGRERNRTFERRHDAERWLADVQDQIRWRKWLDPARSAVRLEVWAEQWLPSRSDLRPSSQARLESVVRQHVLPAFGKRPLDTIQNSEVRAWVGRMTADGMSATSARQGSRSGACWMRRLRISGWP
jgi:hypothetical protein